MILLDTHAAIWLAQGHQRARALERLPRVYLPPASVLELQFLAETGHVRLSGGRTASALAADARWRLDDPPQASGLRPHASSRGRAILSIDFWRPTRASGAGNWPPLTRSWWRNSPLRRDGAVTSVTVALRPERGRNRQMIKDYAMRSRFITGALAALVAASAFVLSATAQEPPRTFKQGEGVSAPRLVKEVKPKYTVEAMDARIEGMVVLDAVVGEDGAVGEVRVTHSLDDVHGLDEEAVKAVKQWQFRPGRKDGVPVAVAVEIELVFKLRKDD